MDPLRPPLLSKTLQDYSAVFRPSLLQGRHSTHNHVFANEAGTNYLPHTVFPHGPVYNQT